MMAVGCGIKDAWTSVDALQAVLDYIGQYDTPASARADAMKE